MLLPDPRTCSHAEKHKTRVSVCTALRLHTFTTRADMTQPTYGGEYLTDLKDDDVLVCLDCILAHVRRKGRSIAIRSGFISIVAAILAVSVSVTIVQVISVFGVLAGIAGLVWGLTVLGSCTEKNTGWLDRQAKKFADYFYLCGGQGQTGRVVLTGKQRKRLELLTPKNLERIRNVSPSIAKDLPDGALIWILSGMNIGRTYYVLPEVESEEGN